MKQPSMTGKLAPWIAAACLALAAGLNLRAQDDANAKKDDPAAQTQPAPAEVSAPAPDANAGPAVPREDVAREDGDHEWRHPDHPVVVGSNFTLDEDEVVDDVVVISGNAVIKGHVTGELVVIGGAADVSGRVDRQMTVVLGSVSLRPTAEIRDELTVVGGTLEREPGAKVRKHPNVVPGFGILPRWQSLQSYVVHGLMLGRPIAPQVGWVWKAVGISLLIYLMVAVLFPRPIQACVQALERRPVGSFFMGVLVFILVGPLTFLLAVSMVGIPVIPFLFCALIVAFLFGKVSVYRFAGAQFGKQLNVQFLQLPLVAFLVGAVLFCLLYAIPFIGFLVWGAVIPFGLGAAVLAAFGGMRREDSGRTNNVAVPPAPAPGPAGAAAAAPSALTPATGSSPAGPGAVASYAAAPSSSVPMNPPLLQTGGSPAELISLPRAGFWRRTCATILDVLLFVFVMIVTGPKALLLWLVYHIAMWAWKGSTVGGIVMGVKLVRVDGRPVDVGVALVRAAAALFSALVGGLGFFWAGWDRDKQSWHDKIAGTLMVSLPKGMPLL